MIYFARCGTTKFVKIGTAKNVVGRLNELQCCCPFKIILLAVSNGGWQREQKIHREFTDERHTGEWFVISERLRAFILMQTLASDFYDSLATPRRSVRLDASFLTARASQ